MDIVNVESSKENCIKSENNDTSKAGDISYLDNFNIDTEADTDSNVPHYIVNLNVYNTSGNMASVQSSNALGTQERSSLQTTSSNSPTLTNNRNVPIVPGGKSSDQPYFVPMFRSRTRGRGRLSNVPLDDVMEKKIRTFEGRDCVQQLEQLHKQFPRFKRAYVNRVFTRCMLNYNMTYQQLKEEDDREVEKVSKVRLIQTPKGDEKRPESKPVRPELTPQQNAFYYMGVTLGRCPPNIANSLYRRVIVTPDGNVESADEHEQKFLDATGLSNNVSNASSGGSDTAAKTHVSAGLKFTPLLSSPGLDSPQGQISAKKDNVESTEPATVPTSRNDENVTPSGNRFFRTNRCCETEMKKRDYLNRELRGTTGSQSSRLLTTNLPTAFDADGGEDGVHKAGDAVKYMAQVGVVSNSATRKRANDRRKISDAKRMSNDASGSNADNFPADDQQQNDGLKLSIEERKQLLSFFNESMMEELVMLPGCSRKTAQTLLTLRPFTSVADLVERTANMRHLSSNLIESGKGILQMRFSVICLLQKCERLTQRVSDCAAKLLENNVSLPSDIEDSFKGNEDGVTNDFDTKRSEANQLKLLTQQPVILNPVRELKPYQLVGLNWLRLLHHEDVNGILADEMGLGKTVQTIAFLASLWENGIKGPHLIICPSSTQDNWQRELSEWCPHLKVLVYQGSAEQRKAIRLKIYEEEDQPDFSVLLTSYAVGTSSIEDRALMKRLNFHYGIFDEAHMLKNMTSQRYRNLMNFHVKRRLLLTGTPLQNNLLELVSLLSFVMPEMFMRSTELLKRMFQIYSKSINVHNSDQDEVPKTSSFVEERLIQAKNLLQPFCLRRLKSQVLDQLPPKTSEIIYVPMTTTQLQHYQSLVKRFRTLRESSASDVKNKEKKLSDSESTHENDENGASSKVTDDEGEVPAKKICLHDKTTVNGTNSLSDEGSSTFQSSTNMIAGLRKAANHQTLLSGLAYNEAILRDIADALHLDSSHTHADPQLIYEDLSVMSDHQVHKVCMYYDVLSSYTLSPELIISGSGKIDWLNKNLPKFIAEGHRILIFSQFVIMLDILEEFLRSTNRRYLRLDGSTPVSERQGLIDCFNTSSIEVFLLSTRAGGLGINLTGADLVIIHDIDFNPYNDRQAEDRCHRLGQKKPVHVIRLISQGTVEEGILQLASDKLLLEQNVTGVIDDELGASDDESTDQVSDTPNNRGTKRKATETRRPGRPRLKDSNNNNNESENVFKVLGSWNSESLDINAFVPHSKSANRVSEHDVRSLLSDALKL